MLYLEHDFYSNFNAGVNSGDNSFISDMITNEISELIVHQHDELIDLFGKINLSINKTATDEKIVDTIINNLSSNVKLSRGLAFLISQNNTANKPLKVVRGSDGVERKIDDVEKPASLPQIDMITSGLVCIGDSFKYKPQLKKEFKTKLMTLIKTKTTAVGSGERSIKTEENKNGGYYFLAILVIGGAIATYFYVKHKKKIAAEGLLVDGLTTPPTPVIEPVVPTPVPTPINTPAMGNNIAPVVAPIAPTVVI